MTPYAKSLPRRTLCALLIALPLLSVARAGVAQDAAVAPRPAATLTYEKSEVMIPVRDGVRLHTMLLTPTNSTTPLPFIMVRTPYGIANGERALAGGNYAELAEEGYIFVFQDIRGRYQSEGQFVMMRQMRDRNDPRAIDESTDAYDTVEWLLKNVPRNNGRVGMLGVSYPGWTTVMAMLDPHPGLKAVSPQASPADMYLGDDFHHNGAFRLSYGFEYAVRMETSKEQTPFTFDEADTYTWYLKLGSLARVNERHLRGTIPTWNDYVAHPNYDAFWQRQAVAPWVNRVAVPTLNVAGWWDQEDFYGPLKIYELLEPHDWLHQNYLVVGPWNHGGWTGATGQRLGVLDYGSPTARHFRTTIQAPWFAYWLKDKGTLNLPEATTFQTGSNSWQRYDSWPPRTNVQLQRLYFHANGALSFDAPTTQSNDAFDAYLSDPSNPVPYRKRPILPTYGSGSTWSRWLVDDQRFLAGRPDVLNWQTAPLSEDVVIAGHIVAHLFASTTGSDADWIVKLIDVYPETTAADSMAGYELMVANEVLRGRFRKSFEQPEAIVPNRVEEYVVDLHSQDYRFRRGHRIKVQVQSTWFPLIDRNPQTYMPNIFEAKDSDFKAATHRIHRSRDAASHVQVSVLRRSAK